MMKKIGMFTLILVLVIAFCLPVSAYTIDGPKGEKMYLGGILMTDFGYWNRSKELLVAPGGNTNGLSDRTEFVNTVPNHSNIRGFFETGQVGGYWELGMGGNTSTITNYIETRLLYGWVNFGNCQLLAGKAASYIYTMVPWQVIGSGQNFHVYGFGWGAVYDQRNPQVRFTQNISNQFGYMITMLQPQVYLDAAASNSTSYATYPQVAVKLMIKLGGFGLFPAFAYQNVKWDKVAKGFDDNMTSWYGVLPVGIKVGGFTALLQGGYGQNLGNASGLTNGMLALQGTLHSYLRDSSGKIKNTTGINGFVDLSYIFGPVTPHIYFGYDNARNSDIWKTGDDNNTRLMVGTTIDYKVADSFSVIPEFSYYDYGKRPNVATRPDIGKEWLAGVQFRFEF